MSNTVLSPRVARQVTGGRTPLVPVEYETAVNALSQCCTLDESRYWSDKADALAAWAKIYRSDETVRKAKMLKLHAYRRMGALAAELNPRKSTRETGGRGSLPGSGPRSLLMRHGLTTAEADAARVLAKLPTRQFEQLLKRPVAPTTARHAVRDETQWRQVQAVTMSLRSRCRQFTPAQVVESMSKVEAENALLLVAETAEWLDAFAARLEKRAKQK
jgi:hypothetical protein